MAAMKMVYAALAALLITPMLATTTVAAAASSRPRPVVPYLVPYVGPAVGTYLGRYGGTYLTRRPLSRVPGMDVARELIANAPALHRRERPPARLR